MDTIQRITTGTYNDSASSIEDTRPAAFIAFAKASKSNDEELLQCSEVELATMIFAIEAGASYLSARPRTLILYRLLVHLYRKFFILVEEDNGENVSNFFRECTAALLDESRFPTQTIISKENSEEENIKLLEQLIITTATQFDENFNIDDIDEACELKLENEVVEAWLVSQQAALLAFDDGDEDEDEGVPSDVSYVASTADSEDEESSPRMRQPELPLWDKAAEAMSHFVTGRAIAA